MSRQRKRHLSRQPIEESVRLAISGIVGCEGFVEVERHSYDWKADDFLVWVRLKNSMGSTALEVLRQRLAEEMNSFLPTEKSFEWLVVVEHGGESIATVVPNIAFNPDGYAAG
jgi:hypothetical protein